jgi:hypothetical protein
MINLELGITPLTVELKEGIKVAFFAVSYVRVKRHPRKKKIHVGRVKSFNSSSVVIEGITVPGLYNRDPHNLFEVHKDMSLASWEQP